MLKKLCNYVLPKIAKNNLTNLFLLNFVFWGSNYTVFFKFIAAILSKSRRKILDCQLNSLLEIQLVWFGWADLLGFRSKTCSIDHMLTEIQYQRLLDTRIYKKGYSILGCFGQSGLEKTKIQTAISILLLRSVFNVFMAKKSNKKNILAYALNKKLHSIKVRIFVLG